MSKIYYKPTSFLYGNEAKSAILENHALPLAGTNIAFSNIQEIIIDNKNISSITYKLSELLTSTDNEIKSTLKNISKKRKDIASLNFTNPKLMGIINTTPDSFSDGGDFYNIDDAEKQAFKLIEEGADIIDIGGESTRPGAKPVSIDEEQKRTIPLINKLKNSNLILSIDTRNAKTMAKASSHNIDIINDVSALTFDKNSEKIALNSKLPIILMHSQGTPEDMQDNPKYDNVIFDIYNYLEERINHLVKAGLDRNKIIIDPGIGFGKTLENNLNIIKNISIYHGLGCPILLGASRKSFIDKIINIPNAKDRVPGSLAAAIIAINQGVQIIRTHDIKESLQAIKINQAILNS